MSRAGHRLPDGRRFRRRIYPVAWFGPVVGSAATVVAWSGVAHSSGSGWVQAIGVLLAAVLLTGLVAPAVTVLRSDVTCSESPSDTTVGSPTPVTLSTRRPVRVRPLSPPGAPCTAGGPVLGARNVTVVVVAPVRGVLDSVVVEVESSAPFGIVWWGRQLRVSLARPMHVAPRIGEPPGDDRRLDDRPAEDLRTVSGGLGAPRGLRPYQPGDSRRAVHWPGTAHTGTLMVRETERPTSDPVVVDVVLPADLAAAELAAQSAMSTVAHHLHRGTPVLLITLEKEGRVSRPVYDSVDAGRRLARAVAPSPTASGGGRS